jgi:peptide/nickel transport system substrate-binding protein
LLGGNFAPAHYLKQFLPKYNPDADANAKKAGFDTWILQWASINSVNTNPDFPTLNPWVVSEISAASALWKRNPYYWRVDTAGNQLPYVDTLLQYIVAEGSSIPAKVMAGEIDWESQGIADYPVLKQNETQGTYKMYLWPDTATSTSLGFALNYTVKDPVLKQIFWDLRFRQALSLAINRDDINQTVFAGVTVPWTAPVSASWTGYEDWMGTYYAEYDVSKANALLDEMGLQWDSSHQYRLRPDGQTLTILGEYAVDWLAYVPDLLQIVVANWADIGVKLDPKFVPEATLMGRYAANDQEIGIWNSDGGDEALARAAYPIRLEPPWHWMGNECCAMSSYPWRLWLDTTYAGVTPQGEEPPQVIKDLYDLVQQWLNTPAGTPEYTSLINQIIKINVENLYYFGTVSAMPRLVAINNRIGNLPAEDGMLGSSMLTPYMPEVVFIRP